MNSVQPDFSLDQNSINSLNPGQETFGASISTSNLRTDDLLKVDKNKIKRKIDSRLLFIFPLIILLGGLFFLSSNLGTIRIFSPKAESSCLPKGLKEISITSNSAEIEYNTEKSCLTEINYGTSSEALLLKIPETTATTHHRIKLSPLLPATTYYYQITVGNEKLSEIRSFLTKPTSIITETPLSGELPTISPTPTSQRFTYENFLENYGKNNALFDLDKNGIVNSADWLLYQSKTK